jgi:hypothetical protein
LRNCNHNDVSSGNVAAAVSVVWLELSMFDLKFSKRAFVNDLMATKSMSVAATAVFACTFLPIAGGAVKPYELREFRAGVGALMNGETSTPSLYPVVHPQWGGVRQSSAPAAHVAFIRTAAFEGDTGLAGAMLDEQGELMPVIQTFEQPLEICMEDCAAELPELEAPEVVEILELEELDEEFEGEAELYIG